MSTTTSAPAPVEPDQRLDLGRVDWTQYVTISDALGERHNPRMIYLDGGLTFLVTSRQHDWYAERLGMLVVAVANGCGILWEDAGQATFRLEEKRAGVEGDKTFYFGANAERMLGPRNLDLASQPPPDLAVEVEVTHPADRAMSTWGRLGVPEVWRFDVGKESVTFWQRREDGTYASIDRSAGLPAPTPADVVDRMRPADSLGSSRWHAQLGDWVRDVLVPRMDRDP